MLLADLDLGNYTISNVNNCTNHFSASIQYSSFIRPFKCQLAQFPQSFYNLASNKQCHHVPLQAPKATPSHTPGTVSCSPFSYDHPPENHPQLYRFVSKLILQRSRCRPRTFSKSSCLCLSYAPVPAQSCRYKLLLVDASPTDEGHEGSPPQRNGNGVLSTCSYSDSLIDTVCQIACLNLCLSSRTPPAPLLPGQPCGLTLPIEQFPYKSWFILGLNKPSAR